MPRSTKGEKRPSDYLNQRLPTKDSGCSLDIHIALSSVDQIS